MKGLDREELMLMQGIVRGSFFKMLFAGPHALERLKRRGLVAETLVNCGARGCPGHPSYQLTAAGVLVLSAVTTVGCG